MPKSQKQKRNAASGGSPYNRLVAKKSSNNIFKMKTDIGQHVLKNPGVAQAIVDKADLKQSDVRGAPDFAFGLEKGEFTKSYRLSLKLVQGQGT